MTKQQIGFLDRAQDAAAEVGAQSFAYLFDMVQRADSWRSSLTGLGIPGRDTEVSYTPEPGRGIDEREASDLRWMNIYAAGLIEEIVEDALKRGWVIEGMDNDLLADIYREWCIEEKVQEGGELGRQFGEAYIWIVTNDMDEMQPLGDSFELVNLIVVDKRECRPVSWVEDASERDVGEASIYNITMARGANSRVHASRLIKFTGRKLPRTERIANGGTHDSVLTQAKGQLTRWGVLEQSAAHLAKEWKVSVVNIDHGEAATDDQAAAAKSASKLKRIARYKSLLSMIVLGINEKFQQVGVPLQGYKDLVQVLAWGMSAVQRKPLVKVFGMAPAGLSTDDEAGRDNYHTQVASYQAKHLTPPVERLHEVLFSASNVELIAPENWSVSWPPIKEQTAEEGADLASKVVAVMKQLVDLGVPLNALLDAMTANGEWRAAAPTWRPDGSSGDTAQLNGAQALAVLEVAVRVQLGELEADVGTEIVARVVGIEIEEARRLVESRLMGEGGVIEMSSLLATLERIQQLGNLSSQNQGLAA